MALSYLQYVSIMVGFLAFSNWRTLFILISHSCIFACKLSLMLFWTMLSSLWIKVCDWKYVRVLMHYDQNNRCLIYSMFYSLLIWDQCNENPFFVDVFLENVEQCLLYFNCKMWGIGLIMPLWLWHICKALIMQSLVFYCVYLHCNDVVCCTMNTNGNFGHFMKI
jgi:hypothetical protein